jgi:hypothetical protein
MHAASRRSALGVLASCVVHVAIVLGFYGHGSAREPTQPTPLWMELQIERREPEPAPDLNAVPPVETSANERADRPAASRSQNRAPARAAQLPTAEGAGVPTPEEKAVRPAATPSPAPSETKATRSAATLDLSPLAAARTLGDSTYFPLRDAGLSRADAPPLTPSAAANALAARVPGLRASRGSDRSMKGVVVDGAEDAIYNVLRPWKLFHKTMRGSQYRYTGAGFDAAILPDGRVRFREKDGLMLTVMVPNSRESGPSAQLPPAPSVGLTLGDPRALWMRIRGKDPFAVERRTFLERTRALREYLSGRAAARGTPEPDESADEVEPEPLLEPADGAR